MAMEGGSRVLVCGGNSDKLRWVKRNFLTSAW